MQSPLSTDLEVKQHFYCDAIKTVFPSRTKEKFSLKRILLKSEFSNQLRWQWL